MGVSEGLGLTRLGMDVGPTPAGLGWPGWVGPVLVGLLGSLVLGLLGVLLWMRARGRRVRQSLEWYARTLDGLLEASTPEYSHRPLKERLASLCRLLGESMRVQGLGLLFYDAYQERVEGLRIDAEARLVEVQYTGRETAMALLEALRNEKMPGDLWESIPPGPHRLTLPLQYGTDLLGILWVVFPDADALRASEKALRVLAHAFTLELKNRLLYEQAVRDSLTGLYTRAYLARRLHEEMSHYRRYQRPFSLIMLDLDHFKEINDTMGHLVGDRVLQMVAQAIRKVLREGDVPARYGGDEFLVLLPGAATADAQKVAQRLQNAIQAITVSGMGPLRESVQCTISVLGDHFLSLTQQPQELVQLVDLALLKAKQTTRGGIWVAESPSQLSWKEVTWPVGWA
ncbi:Response regulator PleD [bacterium HR11]|nr:Response regulator PleD [bacterium HR11]